MTRGMRSLLRLAVAALLVIAVGIYLTGGSTPYAHHAAPDGRGVLELRTPARWQAWRTRDFEMPVVARYVEADGRVIGSTAPIELSGNGTIRWDADGVSIGSSASYDRRTRHWSVAD